MSNLLDKKSVGLILLALALTLSGCSTGHSMSGNEDAWYVEQTNVLFYSYSDVYYCRANKEPSNVVKPKCFQAKMAHPQP